MNKNIDLTKILKECPKGWKLYSPIVGEIDFSKICDDVYAIVTIQDRRTASFTKEGFYYADVDGECLLFPSKDQRDWSKFTAPWYKKERDTIDWIKKQCEPNPYSSVSFKYNGHTWGMCGRDNGVEILVDGEIKERIFLDNEPQGKSALEAIKEEKVDNEPKFKVGDWVVNKFGDSFHIDSLDKKNYQVSDGEGNYNYFPISKQDEIHLWTIQDARDGDVLSFYNEYKTNKMVQVGIIEKYVGKHGGCSNTFKIYIGVNWDNNLQIGKYMGCPNIHPATKEQRDALMKEINDTGYDWDTENKELRRNYLYWED